jgi:hypothetical protein
MKYEDYIKIKDCVQRRVYKIYSRNLDYGIYDGIDGFIGIRTKFNSRFLDTEHHWDTGAPHGTAKPLKDLGIELPAEISLNRSLGTIDIRTNRPVAFDEPVVAGGRGWYYTDTNEADQEIRPQGISNKALFDFLDNIEKGNSND